MQFIQKQLDYEATDDAGLSYLQKLHAGLLPQAVLATEPQSGL
jgi:hypothetical protein